MSRYTLAALAIAISFPIASAVVERGNMDMQTAQARDENFTLRATRDSLRAKLARQQVELATLERAVAWVRWSRVGRLHPELEAIMRESWERSGRLIPFPALVRWSRVESHYNPFAVGALGHRGLFQVRGGSFDPGENTDAALYYLAVNVARFNGDLVKGLSSHNFGPTRVAVGV